MNALPRVTIRRERVAVVQARHPWLRARSLVDGPSDGGLACGQVVDVFDERERWLARGLINPHSELRVRLYSWRRDQELDATFWRDRIDQAIARRRPLGLNGPQSCSRLVFSEADRLSGLIVDRYGPYLVVQLSAAALVPRLDELIGPLHSHFRPDGIVICWDERTAELEGLAPPPAEVRGEAPPDELIVEDSGLQWGVDLMSGQKTGLYLDQRENRLAAAKYLSGAKVLDVCSYVGGFALTAAAAGAQSVLGVDSSAKALVGAAANAIRNGLHSQCTWEQADCFELLDGLRVESQMFDAVILDPPRFAGSRATVETALRAYERLNVAALRVLRPGGLLVTCSCSGRVTRSDFLNMLVAAARRGERDLIVLQHRGAALDHPTLLSCPETDYLKCLIAEAA
jgi:23S rRNA (cytosine1962-C5)-methyltransferase